MDIDVGQILTNSGGSVVAVVCVLGAHLKYLRRDTDKQENQITEIEKRVRKLENDHAGNHPS